MSTYALKHTSKKTAEGNTSTVTLQGKLTIENIEEIKLKLSPILSDAESFVLQTSQVSSLDLSFLQLLESLEKSRPDKKTVLELDVNMEIQKLLLESGFEKYIKL